MCSLGRSDRQQNMSSVSLNMAAGGDDDAARMFIKTPALASRPVPTMLRYLSAKQVIE